MKRKDCKSLLFKVTFNVLNYSINNFTLASYSHPVCVCGFVPSNNATWFLDIIYRVEYAA